MNCHDVYEKFKEIGLTKTFDVNRWEPYGRNKIRVHTTDGKQYMFGYQSADYWFLLFIPADLGELFRKKLDI